MNLREFPYRLRAIEVPDCQMGEDLAVSEDNRTWYLTCMGSNNVIMGDALLELAQGHPERDFIGVEVYPPGIGRFLLRVEQAGLGNVRVVCADAVEVLGRHLPPGSLDELLVLFPDPWPKKRHHKRRLVNAAFLALAARAIAPGGRLHIATDWADYAQAIAELLADNTDFTSEADTAARPPTKYERRGERLGHAIVDFCLRRQ